jgi:hypothetical protein
MDDAGLPTGCLGYVACVENCLKQEGVDAGTYAACSTQCAPGYRQNQTQEGGNLLQCIVGSCAGTMQCGL